MLKPAPPSGSTLENFPVGDIRGSVISQELDELLASPPFRNSKRCQSLLSYVVRETLSDRADRLKERTIGVDVFGREPAYDTNHDAVVRNAAAEVRKRLAQFYVEHHQLIRIELPLGTYIPVFVTSGADKAPFVERPEAAPLPELLDKDLAPERENNSAILHRFVNKSLVRLLLAAALLVGVGIASWFTWRSAKPHPETALDRFWAPALTEREAVEICVEQPAVTLKSAAAAVWDPSERPGRKNNEAPAVQGASGIDDRYLYVGDALAMLKLSQLLQAHGKAFRPRIGARQTNYSDLRGFPSVLIGAFNNDWTLRLTNDLRYYYLHDATRGVRAVTDREHRDQWRWTISDSVSRANVTDDYALVTRLRSPTTERTVISIGGIGDFGTLAAAEFLTDPDYMQKAFEHAPPHWEMKSIQLVLKTHIVGNAPGPPSVEATYFWN